MKKELVYGVSITEFSKSIGIKKDKIFKHLRNCELVMKDKAIPTRLGKELGFFKETILNGRWVMLLTEKGSYMIYNEFFDKNDKEKKPTIKNFRINDDAKKEKDKVQEEIIFYKNLLSQKNNEIMHLKDKAMIRYFPKENDYYHYINSGFMVVSTVNKNTLLDKLRIKNTLVFRLQQSATDYLNDLKRGIENENKI